MGNTPHKVIMAKKHNNELTVGLTITVALALVIYIVVLLADFDKLTTNYQEITFRLQYTDGLGGLGVGSPVQLGGYKVGQVIDTRIQSSDDDPENIQVLFTIELPQKYKLHKDCVLIPETELLGGKATLNIASLGHDQALLSNHDVEDIVFGDNAMSALKKELDPENQQSVLVTLKAAFDRNNKESLLGALSSSARNIDDITGSVKEQVDKNNSLAMITKINSILSKMDISMTDIQTIVNENKTDLRETVKSLKQSAGLVEKELPAIASGIQQVVEKASCSLTTAQDALAEFKALGILASDTMANNRDKLDSLIENMTEVSTNLKLVSREVRRAPWRLLYKPEQKEMEIQATVDTAAAFAAGAERLDNAASTLKKTVGQLGQDTAENSQKIARVLAELENSFSQFHKAEEKLWHDMEPDKQKKE